jgi:hypothetical protein
MTSQQQQQQQQQLALIESTAVWEVFPTRRGYIDLAPVEEVRNKYMAFSCLLVQSLHYREVTIKTQSTHCKLSKQVRVLLSTVKHNIGFFFKFRVWRDHRRALSGLDLEVCLKSRIDHRNVRGVYEYARYSMCWYVVIEDSMTYL